MKRALTVFAAAGLMSGCVATTKPVAEQFEPVAFIVEADKAYIEGALVDVRGKMIDPDSAKFYGVYSTKRSAEQDRPNICGFVNAKNSYGGYVGKTRFLAGGGFVALWEKKPGPYGSIDNRVIRDNCTLRAGETAPNPNTEWK